MLEKFVDMNMEMHKTGSLSASISKEELLRLVSQVRRPPHTPPSGTSYLPTHLALPTQCMAFCERLS